MRARPECGKAVKGRHLDHFIHPNRRTQSATGKEAKESDKRFEPMS
jgi:hypothetical protein